MKSTFLWGVCAASIFLAGAAQAKKAWEKIDVAPGQYHVTVGGEEKLISPSCALGEPYSFQFKPGNRKKLVVYYNGGGACWDSNTCVASRELPPPRLYVESADDIQNDPAEMGGILDVNNEENPYADWSMLFISYCTGDVHLGNTDTDYEFPPGNMITIHHRGFDNSVYAINWLKHIHPEIRPDKLLVAGSSAGSYGAMVNFPTLKRYYHGAKMYGFSDGGMGVIRDTPGFVNAVFGGSSVWNIHENLHPIFTSLPSAVTDHPELFMQETLGRLSDEYPKDKFTQYTTAYDAIQILFWDIMRNLGEGIGNLIGQWYFEMISITGDLRASLPKKYHSYIGPGCNHTILNHNDDFYNSYLTSSKGKTITFLKWLKAMTEGNNNNWQDLSCTPGDCGEESLTDAGIQACLARTFNAP